MLSIRTLVADDHPLIVQALPDALRADGIESVAWASRGEDVLPEYEKSKPDVVVMDIRFGDAPSGLKIASQLLAQHPEARVVFYTQFDQDELISEAYRLGAKGFVTKEKPLSALADAIRQVHSGRTHFLPEIAERLALINVKGDDSPRGVLDKREFQVFELMAQGYTNGEIAEALDLSLKTIANLTPHIKQKLGVQRLADLTLLAVRYKIIDP